MRKALFVLAVGMGLAFMLEGCVGKAGTHPDSASKTSLTSDELDANKIATVNRWALDRGAKLIWINYPQKRQVANEDRGH